MSPRVHASERRFFLREAGHAGSMRLAPGEEEHARRVLRLRAGDTLLGLDGRGREWPLVVTAADRGRFEVAISGEPRVEPAPGEPGAPLPWIELACPLPRGARAEEMLDRLVQLGLASIAPLLPDRAGPDLRAANPARAERLARIAAEACKQSGRLWNLHFEPARTCSDWLADRAGAGIVRLDPRAALPIVDWIAGQRGDSSRFTRANPLCLVLGPEGGFTPGEEDLFAGRSIPAVRLGPHVLRIETAAEAALAVVVASFSAR